jgi:hypothetical protein
VGGVAMGTFQITVSPATSTPTSNSPKGRGYKWNSTATVAVARSQPTAGPAAPSPAWRIPDRPPAPRDWLRPASQDDREVPELRANATPTMSVRIGSFPRREITDELWRSRDLLEDEHETGGFLFTKRFGNPLEVGIATGIEAAGACCAASCSLGEPGRVAAPPGRR